MLLKFMKSEISKENNKILFLLFFSFIFIAFLIYQNFLLRKELFLVNRFATELNNNLNLNSLQPIIKKYLSNEMRKKSFEWNLIIIFTPEDCPFCLDEISFWDDYFQQQQKHILGLWGLAIHEYPELVQNFIVNMGWQFPIYVHQDYQNIMNQFQKLTPIKILMKGTNKIYYFEASNTNWSTKSSLRNIIFSIINPSIVQN